MPNPIVRTLTIGGVTYDLQDNISGYITGITSSDITTALGFTPYNATNPNGYTNNTGTITSVKTTAGAHTTINVSSGAANFNVPTKTSHLTNDSGYITSYTETDPVFSASAAAGITATDISNWNGKSDTDEKLKITAINNTNEHYLICGDSTTTATRLFDHDLSYVTLSNNQQGYSRLQIGNGTPQGTSGAKYGSIRLYGTTIYGVEIEGGALTTWRTITTPDKSGTIALTSDIPSVYSSTNTGGYLTMATLPIYDGTVV